MTPSITRRTAGAVTLVAALLVPTACGTLAPPPGTRGDAATGEVPDSGISPFDDTDPAVARLQPAVRAALQAAARKARADGVEIRLTSGWRSVGYQEQLLRLAVSDHGSLDEAEKWVAPPDRSAHVHGDAVDVGPTDAGSWMDQHGSDHGLCRRYANELWHYELLTSPGGSCPQPLLDATEGS